MKKIYLNCIHFGVTFPGERLTHAAWLEGTSDSLYDSVKKEIRGLSPFSNLLEEICFKV